MFRPKTLAQGEQSDDFDPFIRCLATATTLQERWEMARYMNVGVFYVRPVPGAEEDVPSDRGSSLDLEVDHEFQ